MGQKPNTPPTPPPADAPGAAIQLHELLGIPKQDLPLICPHCLQEVHQLVWRKFGEPAGAAIIGCGNCRKVLGANLFGQIIY